MARSAALIVAVAAVTTALAVVGYSNAEKQSMCKVHASDVMLDPQDPIASGPMAPTSPPYPFDKLADAGTSPSGPLSPRDDAAINQKVTDALQADPTLKAAPIKASTKDGAVTLSGTVDSPDLRTHAHQIAASTPGVASVVDNISVKKAG